MSFDTRAPMQIARDQAFGPASTIRPCSITTMRSADCTVESRWAIMIVVRLPRIANFDEFGPLAAEPEVRLRYVERAGDLPLDRLARSALRRP